MDTNEPFRMFQENSSWVPFDISFLYVRMRKGISFGKHKVTRVFDTLGREDETENAGNANPGIAGRGDCRDKARGGGSGDGQAGGSGKEDGIRNLGP